ncbi:MAG: 4'-phosphopantetheinyl transferase superfamily protein [Armatimonadota bacterium]
MSDQAVGRAPIGVGIDLADPADFAAAAPAFLKRVFTDEERRRCDARRDRAVAYAEIWAAKEAAVKAVGGVWHLPQVNIDGGRATAISRQGETPVDPDSDVAVSWARAGDSVMAVALAWPRKRIA